MEPLQGFHCTTFGVAGDLAVQVKTRDWELWNGKGSLASKAVKKVAPPNINTAQQLNNKQIQVCIRVPIVYDMCVHVCVHVHNHWVPGRVAFRLKATPVKIRIL